MSHPNHAAALALLDKITPGPWAVERNRTAISNIGPCVAEEYAGAAWIECSEPDARATAALPEFAALYRAGVQLQMVRDVRHKSDESAIAALKSAYQAFDAALAAVADKLTQGERK